MVNYLYSLLAPRWPPNCLRVRGTPLVLAVNAYYVDALYAQRLNNVTFAEGEYFQRRQERAHRLYLSAIRTLAQVQRLLVA
jgi:hypothetical protein